MRDEIRVIQFRHKEDAEMVITEMNTDELELRRNEIRGQYVVYPTTEDAGDALEFFVDISGDELEISRLDGEHLVEPSEFEDSVI